MTDASYVTVENWEVKIHGRVYVIPSMTLRMYPNGERAIALDEYNKILQWTHEQDKRQRNSRKRFSDF